MLLPLSALAFEDTVERYTTNYGDFWDGPDTNHKPAKVTDPTGIPDNNVLKIDSDWTGYTYIMRSNKPIYPSYFSWTQSRSDGTSGSSKYVYQVLNYNTNAVIANFEETYTSSAFTDNSKLEITFSASTIDLYLNGVKIDTKTNTITDFSQPIKIQIGLNGAGYYKTMWLDDFSSGSIIGGSQLFTESATSETFTWSSALMRSYADAQKITLYSLTNPDNAGEVTHWDIPGGDNAATAEHGYVTYNRASVLANYFGLYILEMTRGDSILTDQYFYYDQSSNPQGFPQILFLGESSVRAIIRDEDNNGGEVEGGGSVYLYPDINTPANYVFTYDILETPYAISTELSTAYNTSAINSLRVDYSGLSSMSYNVSIDGAATGQTGGSDTYTHNFTGAGLTTPHIIAFSPDYSAPGVWGAVKDSVTQEGIKSATVSITGTNFGKTLYTDDNGLYYLTNGITAGEAYTITVTKPGYTSPPSQVATTQAGVTTRQDFYMDSIASENGEGLYYAPHSVTFTILENWYNYTGLPGVPYFVYNTSSGEQVKTGLTDSKGQFTVKEMNGGTNYTINLSYMGQNITEYIEPGLGEYTFVLNMQTVTHSYYNNWLSLTYSQNTTNATVTYASNKTLTGASLIATASNGTIAYTQSLSSKNGSFIFPFSPGDYSLQFNITASDGSKASQVWTISNPATVNLFPTSYPVWLKNLLFTAIIILFLLAFGKAKNDIACGSVAVLTSFGYFFHWLTCSFNFVVLVWIIAAGAIYLHYKRTGATG